MFDFLASGRCVIGTESGSSALDPYGELRRFEAAWRAEHPDATFEEFSALQRPGWDDYDFTAISPRLSRPRRRRPRSSSWRASTTASSWPIVITCRCVRTCRTSTRRWSRSPTRAETEAFAERAWEDLILSGRYSYGAFAAHVETVVEEVAGDRPRRGSRGERAWRAANATADGYSNVVIRTPRLAHRFALRHAPWLADLMTRGARLAARAALVPRPVSAPLWRAGSPRSLAFGGRPRTLLVLSSTRRRARCERRCARSCTPSTRARRRHRVVYWNAGYPVPRPIRELRVDALVLDNTLLVARWAPGFEARRASFAWIASSPALKLAFPQDEYNHAHVLDDWLDELGVDVVFSIYGSEYRERLYPRWRAVPASSVR